MIGRAANLNVNQGRPGDEYLPNNYEGYLDCKSQQAPMVKKNVVSILANGEAKTGLLSRDSKLQRQTLGAVG